jgi:hypothetical protein
LKNIRQGSGISVAIQIVIQVTLATILSVHVTRIPHSELDHTRELAVQEKTGKKMLTKQRRKYLWASSEGHGGAACCSPFQS